ncbi:MAG: extracellular solute-binding protein [Spirochaetales bacterium]|uniref:Extracellular solute-binding protein n=1 Tax=Candidatus Thalassospirochaeta sargassi TaxID=3119039 RepID=A0AAJ1IHC5_9SPIO|nr:extracellular solute-binding protein [Spirochaetales bacterium]
MRYNRIVLLLTAAAALLSSCNGGFGVIVPSFEEYNGHSVKNIELKAAHNFTSGSLPAFSELAAEFNAENEYGFSVKLTDDNINQNSTGLDLVFCSPADAAKLLRRGMSVELSPLITHPRWGLDSGRRIFYRAAAKQTDYFDFARKITSVPLLMNSGVVLTNSRLMQEAGIGRFPANWFSFNRILRKIGENGSPALGLQLDTDSIVSFINARGGSILRPIGFNYSLNNPVVNRTLRYLRRLEDDGLLSVNTVNYINQTMFTFGRLPAVFIWTDGLPHYEKLAAMTNPELNWEVNLLPTRRPGKSTVINCTYSAAVLNSSSERELASWLFLRWLLQPEQQKRLAMKTASLPVVAEAAKLLLTDADNSGAYGSVEQVSPHWLDALRLVDDAHKELVPSLSDYSAVSENFSAMLERIEEGEWIWIETMKLNYRIKKMRHEENAKKAGKR